VCYNPEDNTLQKTDTGSHTKEYRAITIDSPAPYFHSKCACNLTINPSLRVAYSNIRDAHLSFKEENSKFMKSATLWNIRTDNISLLVCVSEMLEVLNAI
jgi:hypothetical protein